MKTFEVGSLVNGRYEILREIGRGGVGRVYQALDQEGGQIVALKVLHASIHADDTTIEQRVKHEASRLVSLDHRHIVKTYGFDRTGSGYWFMIMECVDGGALSKRLRRGGAPPEKLISFNETLTILHQVAEALAYLHEHDILYGVLKPENVLLSAADGVKMSDFAFARIASRLDMPTFRMPHYASPEQIQGQGRTKLSDIYALGIMAFEIANGFRPFEGDLTMEPVQIMQLHLQEPLPEFADQDPPIPDWFKSFVKKCAMKKPSRRFESMAQVVKVLERRMIKRGLISRPDVPSNSSFGRLINAIFGAELL